MQGKIKWTLFQKLYLYKQASGERFISLIFQENVNY